MRQLIGVILKEIEYYFTLWNLRDLYSANPQKRGYLVEVKGVGYRRSTYFVHDYEGRGEDRS